MWANNETGTIFPVEALAEEAKAVGALFHTDAVQAVGKIPVDLKSTAIDMLSLSGHKFHAPKGIGALYVRRGVRFKPVFKGGQQERGRRAGTENTPGIVGLGAAADLALRYLPDEQTRVRALRDRLEKGVMQRVERTILIVGEPISACPIPQPSRSSSSRAKRSCCTCRAPASRRRPVLPVRRVRSSPRMSCGRWTFPSPRRTAPSDSRSRARTRIDDVDRVLEVVPEVIAKLRGLSPFWSETGASEAEAFKPVYA